MHAASAKSQNMPTLLPSQKQVASPINSVKCCMLSFYGVIILMTIYCCHCQKSIVYRSTKFVNVKHNKNYEYSDSGFSQSILTTEVRTSSHLLTRSCTHTHTCACMHNHFMALLDFVWDYMGEPAPER